MKTYYLFSHMLYIIYASKMVRSFPPQLVHFEIPFFFSIVVIVGHTSCGGAEACLKAAQTPNFNFDGDIATIDSHPDDFPLNRWLEPLTRLVSTLPLAGKSQEEALPIVIDANVVEQVERLALSKIIQGAWENGHPVRIHGWVYDLRTGLLRDLGVTKGP
jgi:carbonic anhydrase